MRRNGTLLGSHNTFERSFCGVAKIEELADLTAWRAFYEPHGIGDQMRAILYSGQECIGVLAMCRGTLHSFSADEKRAADKLFDRIRDLYAQAFIKDASSERFIHLVLNERGDVQFACPRGRIWLNSARREQIVAAVVSAEPRRVGQYRAHFERLSNGSFFATLEPYPSVQLELSLSKSEQRLVQLLKKGFTNEEIAQAFGVSESTIKYHLRSLFGALDCDSRTGLVRSIS
jgi:ATP/maltotriose-dependent transcriptional regulator MalT